MGSSRYRLLAVVAFGVLAAVLPVRQVTAVSGFTDVPSGVYYEAAVGWLVDQTITTGTSATTFSPDDPVTRGQMAAFLYRFGFEPNGVEHGFGDVSSGVYYDTAVGWLLLHSITNGTGPGTYGPDDAVTRAQIATFLWRYAGEPAPVSGNPFTDVPGGVWYGDAVAWMVGEGITNGTSPSTFSPDAVVTRGQMATFLWRFAGEPSPAQQGSSRNPVVELAEVRQVVPGTVSESTAVSGLVGSAVDVVVVDGTSPSITVNTFASGSDVIVSVAASLAASPESIPYLLAAVSCGVPSDPCPLSSRSYTPISLDVVVIDAAISLPDFVSIPMAGRWVQAADGARSVPGERVVVAVTGASPGAVATLVESSGGLVVGSEPSLDTFQARYATEADALIAEVTLEASLLVEGVVPYAGQTGGIAQEPGEWGILLPDAATWTFKAANAPAAWDRKTGAASVAIGVVDVGIFVEHEDLSKNVASAESAYGSLEASWSIPDGSGTLDHGSHVAGTVCADQNGIGVVGVMWDCSLDTLDLGQLTDTFGWDPLIIASRMASWMRRHPETKIINMSWSIPKEKMTPEATTIFNRLFSNASSDPGLDRANRLFVIAAGNDSEPVGLETPQNLGSLPNVVVVGSYTSGYEASDFSNTGAEVAAPGGSFEPDLQVLSLGQDCTDGTCNSTYAWKRGTSMAAPFVTGVAGLMLSYRPSLTATQLATCITGDAAIQTLTGGDGVKGIDVNAALDCAEANAPATFECDAQTSISAVECEALVAIYNATDGPNWKNNSRWMTEPNPCSWYGVTCSNGYVERIILTYNGLNGSMPREVGSFGNLTALNLSGGSLSGPIPPEIGNLDKLVYLSLVSTQLSGPIPPEIGGLVSLQYLDFEYSYSIGSGGPLPDSIGNLTSLKSASFERNAFSGPLPDTIGNLTNLTDLNLSYIGFGGEIPRTIGNMTSLVNLNTHASRLTGSIPSEIGQLSNLQILHLDGGFLTGPIPGEIGNLSSLLLLMLDNNALSGSIPSELGQLEQLYGFSASGNNLTGPIPSVIGDMSLASISLRGNRLVGTIPSTFGNLRFNGDLDLDVSDNELSGTLPSEMLDLSFQYLRLRGQTGCLVTDSPALESYILGFDSLWNDGCPLP